MTKNPVKNPMQSPIPTGKQLDDAANELERQTILAHPNYSESEVVYLKPGFNKFENDEHAEYIYATLGNPEEAGAIPIGAGRWAEVKNKNFVLEVDKAGEEYAEIRDHFFLKYRQPTGSQTVKEIDPENFKLKP